MRNRDVIVAAQMVRARARRWLIRSLDRLVVWLGGPSAYYEGIPARRALDDVACVLDAMGVPRGAPTPGGDEWPLLHHQRIRSYLQLDYSATRMSAEELSAELQRTCALGVLERGPNNALFPGSPGGFRGSDGGSQ